MIVGELGAKHQARGPMLRRRREFGDEFRPGGAVIALDRQSDDRHAGRRFGESCREDDKSEKEGQDRAAHG